MTKISFEQNYLMRFLAQYPVADLETCYILLGKGCDSDARTLSYRLRPLVRHGYITRRKDGLYSLLAKGRDHIWPAPQPVMTSSGNLETRKRAASIAKVAALFYMNGIPSNYEIDDSAAIQFIPSPAWRKLRQGLISTVRFHGMLLCGSERLAVYDIGDGTMEWQTYAECSLHFRDYGSRETRATGILLICNDGMGPEIGAKIIRQTMPERKRLLKTPSHYAYENPKRRKVSKSPIKLNSDYQHVYLTERCDLISTIKMIFAQEKLAASVQQDYQAERVKGWPGICIENASERIFLNAQNDLLYLAMVFKNLMGAGTAGMPLQYSICMRQKYGMLPGMYKLPLDGLFLQDDKLEALLKHD